MNPEMPSSPSGQTEAKITALLLGELPPVEASEWRAKIAADPHLAALAQRLSEAIGLVRAASREQSPSETGESLHLASQRRESLLAHFKTVAPLEMQKPRPRMMTLLPLAACIAVLGVLVSFLFQSFLRRQSEPVELSAALPEQPQAPPPFETVGSPVFVKDDQAATEKLNVSGYFVDSVAATDGLSVAKNMSPAEPAPARIWGERRLDRRADLKRGVFYDGGAEAEATRPTPDATRSTDSQFDQERNGNGVFSGGSGGGGGASRGAVAASPATVVPPPVVVLGEESDQMIAPQQRLKGVHLGWNLQREESKRGELEKGVAYDSARPTVSVEPTTQADVFYRSSTDKSKASAADAFSDLPVLKTGKKELETLRSERQAGLPSAAPKPVDSALHLYASSAAGDSANADTARLGIVDQSSVNAAKSAVSDVATVSVIGAVGESDVSGRVRSEKREGGEDYGLRVGGVAGQTQQPEGRANRARIAKDIVNAPNVNDADEGIVATRSRPSRSPITPQPEVLTRDNSFSTFSLNVSDVSFKLAAASLEQGQMPDAASIRSEEFINAFNYHDPEAASGAPVAFAWERARYPFAHNRDLLRFSVKAGATGRQAGRALNVVLVLDNSGSMERADRVRIVRAALDVLAGQLQPQDKLSIITFARTPHLVIDGVAGNAAVGAVKRVASLTPEGGTNLEAAMRLAYQTAARHFQAAGINRLVLLTDGAANLGDVEPESLQKLVQAQRQQGIALDCFGVGWEGYNDDLLEVLARHGDGRYGFINSPEAANAEFASQLAGALQVAASDVKVQVEFNPRRVRSFRQMGYAKHQLTKEQFRDNTVDAGEIAAQEAGNALYTVEVDPAGVGAVATVRVRYKVPGTTTYREHAWEVPYNGNAAGLAQGTSTLRLAAVANAFSEWLAGSPFAAEINPDALLVQLAGVPEKFPADPRPKQLEWMIRQAKSISGK